MAYVDEPRSPRYTVRRPSRAGAAAGGTALLIARLIRFCFGVVAGVIVIAIVLRLCNANPSNDIVHNFHRAGYDFVGPFRGLFSIHNLKVSMVVNWGLAALVISAVGGFLASLVARIGLAAER